MIPLWITLSAIPAVVVLIVLIKREVLRHKIIDLERDPLKVQSEELGEARTAQAVHKRLN